MCMCVWSVSVCPPLRVLITSGVPVWLIKQVTFDSFYMAAIVGIISRHGLNIDACCRDQWNKSKLVMYVLPITFTLKIAILHAITFAVPGF